MLLVGSLAVAGLLIVLGITSIWLSPVLTREADRWVISPSTGIQELHSTSLALEVYGGLIRCTQTRTLSQIGPIGSAATSPPGSHWDFFVVVGARHERSWDQRWLFDRWNNWRLGDLGWYQSAGGGAISRILSVPLWMPIVLCVLPGAFAARASIRSSRRRARGRCVRCGYRLVDDGQPCPECGCGPAGPPGLPGQATRQP